MKICQIVIKKSIQFQDCVIDLTYPQDHPKAGQPLEKVCFIGQNGTGKTRLLELIGELFDNYSLKSSKNTTGFFEIQYQINEKNYKIEKKKGSIYLDNEIFNHCFAVFVSENLYADFFLYKKLDTQQANHKNRTQIYDIYKQNFVPSANLNESLSFSEHIKSYVVMQEKTINEFWSSLIYLIKHRENNFAEFHNANENYTLKQAKELFNKDNPSILEKIAQLWDRILEPLGLYFDIETAKVPIQLTENLAVFIKDKKNKQNVPFHLLSSGIQNFIFKLGYLFTLHFYNQDKNSLVLVDEPEDSLHPKFLYGLIDLYKEITGGEKSQLFVATHSELIAAQFEPYERIILDFDPDKIGEVIIRKGVAPKGQNAADLLMNDFGTTFYQHEDAEKAFEHFLELKNLIRNTENEAEKLKYAEEAENLAFKYKFPTFQKRQKN